MVDIALQVARGQDINEMGKFDRYCDRLSQRTRSGEVFEWRGEHIEGLSSRLEDATQQSLLALNWKRVYVDGDWTEYDDSEPLWQYSLPLNLMGREREWEENYLQARAEAFGEVEYEGKTEATEETADDQSVNLETSQLSHMGDGQPDFGMSTQFGRRFE